MIALLARIAAIIAGSLLIAIGIHFFLMPFKLLDGGMIGVALILNYLFGAKVGLTIIVCSIPIFALAWFRARALFYLSLHGMLVSSFVIDLMEPYHYYFMYYIELGPLSSALIGGLLIGTGFGVMLRNGSSTGGMDLLAQMIADTVPVNVGALIFIIDGVIVCLGGLLLSAETFVLSIVSIAAGGVATALCTMRIKWMYN